MIKKILLAIMIAIPMCATAQKFGTVNVEPIFQAMPERATAQAQLEASQKQFETELQNLGKELEKKYAEYQAIAEDASTPESIKERRIQEIQELEQKIQQFRATAGQELQRQQAQLMAPIESKIMEAIKAVGAENGFTFIFPAEVATFAGSDVIDVTPLVKAKLGLQ